VKKDFLDSRVGSVNKLPKYQSHNERKNSLLDLPNLFLRSLTTLAGLYAILGLVLITAVEYVDLAPSYALIFGGVIAFFQFVLGPFFMDFSLRLLYKIDWVNEKEIPEHLNKFLDRACVEQKIKKPRFGIIKDGSPQAFTYGHVPSNARIVISQGTIDLLDEDELEAVVAHEIGHAVNWDMLLMAVVQFVPLVLYYVYRTLGKSSSDNKAKDAIRIGAYVLYIICQYIVLWFSRTREYHADRFAGKITNKPHALSSALVKIAYGLASSDATSAKSSEKEDSEEEGNSSSKLDALGGMGIFNRKAATALAMSSHSSSSAEGTKVDKALLKGAMRWDLWNPWAKWHEIHSTHPLVANRLRYLSNQAFALGQDPYIIFDEKKTESYFREFFVDLSVYLSTKITLVGGFVAFLYADAVGNESLSKSVIAISLTTYGLALIVHRLFAYKGGSFENKDISSLLQEVKVSSVRAIPCTLKGKIIGKGVPGYVFSEDFTVQDDTGIMFLDYRQPFAVWDFIFGAFKAEKFQGQEVEITGWYRRSPMPYIEIKTIKSNDNQTKSWLRHFYLFSGVVLFLSGLVFSYLSISGGL